MIKRSFNGGEVILVDKKKGKFGLTPGQILTRKGANTDYIVLGVAGEIISCQLEHLLPSIKDSLKGKLILEPVIPSVGFIEDNWEDSFIKKGGKMATKKKPAKAKPATKVVKKSVSKKK